MSIIIFFGGASVILLTGFIVIGVTLRHWYKENRLKKVLNKNLNSQETQK